MLNITIAELKLISNPDMYLIFVKGMGGGLPYISKRYNQAKNKQLKSYSQKQESKPSIYLHANNLYGYAMSEFFPTGGFKWIDPKGFDLNRHKKKSSKGCVHRGDFEYPKELHEYHSDYRLTPDEKEI